MLAGSKNERAKAPRNASDDEKREVTQPGP